VSLAPADLLGLPAPDPLHHVSLLRYLLVALALLWSAAILGRRPLLSLAAVVLFVEAAIGFWVLALGRPYGSLVDPEATRLLAAASVAAETGRSDEGAVAGTRVLPPGAALLARLPLSPQARLLVPTLLPLAAAVALGLAVAGLWGRRDLAILGASLWLAFGTGELDALGGEGFANGVWQRPLSSLAILGLAPLLLLFSRFAQRRLGVLALGLAAGAALSVLPVAGPSPGVLDGLRWLTLDQALWLPLGLYGLTRSRDVAPRALVLAGVLVVLTAAFGFGVDAWAGHALYRLGLLLAATGPLASLATAIGRALAAHPRLAARGLEPLPIGVAALVACAAPGSFLAWWDPPKLDPVAKASLAPLSPNLLRPMEWIRRETPREAVFMAGPEYSAALATLAGRRVLRAPFLEEAKDDERRVRTERVTLSGRDSAPLRARYRVSHVLVAPGDFRAHGLRAPEDLAGRGGFRLLYSDAEGLRVYELE
jgi:hypothetical protein